MATLPMVIVQHPVGGLKEEDIKKKAELAIDDVINCMGRVGEKVGLETEETFPRVLEVEGEDLLETVSKTFMSNGWGDGLPLVPPTEENVKRMLSGTSRSPENLVAILEPSLGEATVEKIAINAVMAGAQPEYLPVIIAAVEAISDPKFNLKGVQTTTGSVTPLIIVNGPIGKSLKINSGAGCLGPGWQANATIGRALRLIMVNIGGARAPDIDHATFGQPAKFTYCIAENEEENPWSSLSMELGFSRETNTVTVIGVEGQIIIPIHVLTTAKGILEKIALSMIPCHPCWEGEILCVLSPEAVSIIKGEGYTKDDVKHVLFTDARMSLEEFKKHDDVAMNLFSLPKWYELIQKNAAIPLVRKAEDFVIIVAGGPGKHVLFTYAWTPGTRMITREIKQ